jgi:hypothetical protein
LPFRREHSKTNTEASRRKDFVITFAGNLPKNRRKLPGESYYKILSPGIFQKREGGFPAKVITKKHFLRPFVVRFSKFKNWLKAGFKTILKNTIKSAFCQFLNFNSLEDLINVSLLRRDQADDFN